MSRAHPVHSSIALILLIAISCTDVVAYISIYAGVEDSDKRFKRTSAPLARWEFLTICLVRWIEAVTKCTSSRPLDKLSVVAVVDGGNHLLYQQSTAVDTYILYEVTS